MKQQEEIDPSVFLYDEVYDEIKGKKEERERSRDKPEKGEGRKGEEPRQSKYINKMKQLVSGRQKEHEVAYERKIKRENEKLGVSEEMVFVSESFLKVKQQEKEAERLRKAEEEKNEREAPEKGDYLQFKKKMLEQAEQRHKPK